MPEAGPSLLEFHFVKLIFNKDWRVASAVVQGLPSMDKAQGRDRAWIPASQNKEVHL